MQVDIDDAEEALIVCAIVCWYWMQVLLLMVVAVDDSASFSFYFNPSRPAPHRTIRRRRRQLLGNSTWYHSFVLILDEADFRSHFRVSRALFNRIVSSIDYDDQQQRASSLGRPSVQRRDAVAILLWRLATTESYRQLAVRAGVGRSTVCRVSRNVMRAIVNAFAWTVRFPSTEHQIVSTSVGFKHIKGLPRVIGAIDGTHIRIPTPNSSDPTPYINRKNYASIIMQAVCDADGIITHCYIAYPGSVHDSRVYRNSELFTRSDEMIPLGYYLLGDSAYPLSRSLMSPFKGNTTREQRIYNTYHSCTRMPIEHAFGRLKGRWRRLQYMDFELCHVRQAIVCCVMLHNLCHIQNDVWEEEFRDDEPVFAAADIDDANNAAPRNMRNALVDLCAQLHNTRARRRPAHV